jgi:hypothetical protein
LVEDEVLAAEQTVAALAILVKVLERERGREGAGGREGERERERERDRKTFQLVPDVQAVRRQWWQWWQRQRRVLYTLWMPPWS